LAAILALTTLTGCVTIPQIDPDLAYDIPTANEAQALTIMRAESIKLTKTPFVPGNRVQLLENGPTTYAAGRAHYGDLLEAGVHIYERHGTVLHAKTAVIDSVWSLVGSANRRLHRDRAHGWTRSRSKA
jgi:phosphatidylserine/phosphatidylglycerophosphate/cardiolipin synthase-like enzyme